MLAPKYTVPLTTTGAPRTGHEEMSRWLPRTRRSRGPLRRTDPIEALDLWRGLVDGRWSLLEHHESDGRRYLVAIENPPTVTDPRRLSTRERQVVHCVADGNDNVLVGYRLGISASAVASHLSTALRKLGLGSRSELITLVRGIREPL